MLNSAGVEKLVFLEFVDEAKAFLSKYRRELNQDPCKFKIISFHPVLKAWLLNRSIQTIDSFYFCPVQSHKTLLTKLDEYTKEIRSNYSCGDKSDLKTSYIENVIFSLRSIISHWLYRVEVILNAIEHYQPAQVITAGSNRINIAYSLWVENSERYIVDIVKQVCSAGNIPFVNITMSVSCNRLNARLFRGLKSTAKNVLCRLWPERIDKSKKMVIVPLTGHNIISLLLDLRNELKEDWKIVILDLPFKDAVGYLWNKYMKKNIPAYNYFPYDADSKIGFTAEFKKQKDMLRDKLFKIIDSCNYRGVTICWLKDKYKYVLEIELVEKTYYQMINLSRFIDKFKPGFVLTQYARQMTAVMAELCREKNIPSLMIPHGSFTPITDDYSKLEWKENALGNVDTLYKYIALQTPLIEKFLRDIPVKSQPVITGPLIFGRKIKSSAAVKKLKQKYAFNGEKVILYASTPKYRKSQRFLNYETIDEYVDTIATVVSTVEQLKGVHLIIRHRIIDGLGPQELRTVLLEADNYSIASEGSFINYLSIADLLISYSSSTVEEALQNDIPVLLFNKYNRYQYIRGCEFSGNTKNLMPAAVYNVNNSENLLFGLNWILHNHLPYKDSLTHLFERYKYKPEDRTKVSELIQGGIKEFANIARKS